MSGLSPVAADVVRVVVGLGTVVVLPLGLRLLGDRAVPRSRSVLWPTVGVLAAVSVWLPVGAFAALLAVPFALAGVVLAACALRVRGFSTAVALATPLVGAVALVAERAGWGLLGFSGDYLALTVPHMLFAGFGACLVVGLVAQGGRLATREDGGRGGADRRAPGAGRLLRLGRRRAGGRGGPDGRALVRCGRRPWGSSGRAVPGCSCGSVR